MGEYNTVFIFTEKANLQWTGSGELGINIILFIAISIWVLYSLHSVLFNNNRKYISHFILSVILFLFMSAGIWSNYEEVKRWRNEYEDLQKRYVSEDYNIAEGTVDLIQVGRRGGHDGGDIIQIDGIEFSISFFERTYAYSQPIRYGGALLHDVVARIYYYVDDHDDYKILRVDVKE
ncbi:MAG: hypothetical protein GY755_25635 [Chloroflexi bacterium]|nr:hypothetical protein [Chloroflexota bacterium]